MGRYVKNTTTHVPDFDKATRSNDLRAVPAAVRFVSFEPLIGSVLGATLNGIQWAIVGGESGPSSRPIEPVWIDEIFDMCVEANTAFFFKQWGGKNKKATGRIYRHQVWEQMPHLSM